MRAFLHPRFLFGVFIAFLAYWLLPRQVTPGGVLETSVPQLSALAVDVVEIEREQLIAPRPLEPREVAEATQSPRTPSGLAPTNTVSETQTVDPGDFVDASPDRQEPTDRLPGVLLDSTGASLAQLVRLHDCVVALYDEAQQGLLGAVDPTAGRIDDLPDADRYSSRVIVLDPAPDWVLDALDRQESRRVRPVLLLSRDLARSLEELQRDACRRQGLSTDDVYATRITIYPNRVDPFEVKELL